MLNTMKDKDIDYAARAVLAAMRQKFGDRHDLSTLSVEPRNDGIRVAFADQSVEGTRDDLMIAIRKASDPADIFNVTAGDR